MCGGDDHSQMLWNTKEMSINQRCGIRRGVLGKRKRCMYWEKGRDAAHQIIIPDYQISNKKAQSDKKNKKAQSFPKTV